MQPPLPFQPEDAKPLREGTKVSSRPRPPDPIILGRTVLIPTPAFDTYWTFAAKRQATFVRRVRGTPPPWTDDPILAKYRFTNVYRATDRASQYLIKLQYSGPQSDSELFFRTILFRLFNKVATWETLQSMTGELAWRTYDYKHYARVLADSQRSGVPIYSSAYIVPPVRMGEARKLENHLRLIERMMAERVPWRLAACQTAESAYHLLLSYPGLGSFLAYQLLIDLNYTTLLSFSEMEFVVAGPGARDGIRKCFQATQVPDADIIRYMADNQNAHFERLGLAFDTLWGRPLQLIDCQNIFCETDKYARVAHPELQGRLGRVRIKRTFRTSNIVARPWFPPKWGLNHLIDQEFDGS